MILFRNAAVASDFLNGKKMSGKSIGFVPTMGALHAGHLSLIAKAKEENNLVVCSIFVNPAQFNDPGDLERYPRPIERDIELLTLAGCDVLLLPSVEDIYPREGLLHLHRYALGHLEHFLEGRSRPGHFQGVANVVDRLLSIVNPDNMYLGQKDFQQVKVLEWLVANTGRSTHIVICPILREENGLAMSSRNIRLGASNLEKASIIFQSLQFAAGNYQRYAPSELQAICIKHIESFPNASVDYLEFCDTDSFQSINDWRDAEHIVAVTAVMVSGVRLLDNMLIK